MSLRTILFGLQKEDILGKDPVQLSALYLNQVESTASIIGVGSAVLCLGAGIWGLVSGFDPAKILPYVGVLLSFLAVSAIRLAGVMPMLQMIQSEQQHQASVRVSQLLDEILGVLRGEQSWAEGQERRKSHGSAMVSVSSPQATVEGGSQVPRRSTGHSTDVH